MGIEDIRDILDRQWEAYEGEITVDGAAILGIYSSDDFPCMEDELREPHDETFVPSLSGLIVSLPDLLAVVEGFVELFRSSDMRPEDECNELYVKAVAALDRADVIERPAR